MLLGVYKDIHPFNIMTDRRINAYVKEAKKQNVNLVFFGIHDVDFTTETIMGDVMDEGKWVKRVTPFPALLINDAPSIEKYMLDKDKEKQLRRMIPSTTHLIENKLKIYERMLEKQTFAEYVIPSQKVNSLQTIISFLTKYSKIVLKPFDGRQGKGIFIVWKAKNDQYIWQEHKQKYQLNFKMFVRKVKNMIEMGNYLVQPFLNCKTREGKPYDFRIHVMRNNRAEWTIIRLQARKGDIDTNLSNVSLGGKTEQSLPFLKDNFGEEKGQYYFNLLEKVALDLARHIDSFYPFTLDELGIDLAIDKTEKIWMYEVNTLPQIFTYDEERAIHVIGYAKFVVNLLKDIPKDQLIDKYFKINEWSQ